MRSSAVNISSMFFTPGWLRLITSWLWLRQQPLWLQVWYNITTSQCFKSTFTLFCNQLEEPSFMCPGRLWQYGVCVKFHNTPIYIGHLWSAFWTIILCDLPETISTFTTRPMHAFWSTRWPLGVVIANMCIAPLPLVLNKRGTIYTWISLLYQSLANELNKL